MPRATDGSAHGRFQPFHRGHLEYVLGALANCSHLWLGITQFNIDRLKSSPTDRHREDRVHNPLTFFERVAIIRAVLGAEGVSSEDYTIIPFPIDEPKLLPDFLPTSVKIFTTVYDDWNRHKIRLLAKYGYEVVALWERDHKEYSGISIRQSMIDGEDGWRSQVTEAAAAYLEKLKLAERMRVLSQVQIAKPSVK